MNSTDESTWIRKWVLIAGVLLIVGTLMPIIVATGSSVRVVGFWTNMARMPWTLSALMILSIALTFLPLILRSKQESKPLASSMAVYSVFSIMLSGAVMLMVMGGASIFSLGRVVGGMSAIVFMAWFVVPLALFIIGMAIANNLDSHYPDRSFPVNYMRFAAALLLILFVLLMLTNTGFGRRGKLIFEALFLSERVWEKAWFMLISIILLLVYTVIALIHSFTRSLNGFLSLYLKLLMVVIPVLIFVGILTSLPRVTGGMVITMSSVFVKVVCSLFGSLILLGASVCSVVRQNA